MKSNITHLAALFLFLPCLANCVASRSESDKSISHAEISSELTDSNEDACGSDLDCSSGQSCVDGICIMADGADDADGGVLVCSSGSECPVGQACISGICADPDAGPPPSDGGVDGGPISCSSGAECPAGQSCVSGVCIDPDAGPPPVDGGPPPVDAGPPPVDAGPPPVDGAVLACASDADCEPGQACFDGVCQ